MPQTAKHHDQPWHHNPADSDPPVVGLDCACRIDGEGMILCPMHDAAPELLEACKRLLNCAGLHLVEQPPGDLAAIDAARAAIAKAGG